MKATYAELLQSTSRPNLFVDIGANYGTHSLAFLAHGVTTLAFEPNPACVRHFEELCQVNGYHPTVEQVALGDVNGVAQLRFPRRATWHGTTRGGDLVEDYDVSRLATRTVRLRKLDDYLPGSAVRPVLIKIDTEGSELAILSGATRTLEELRPTIVFESIHAHERRSIFELLERFKYAVFSLPRDPGAGSAQLGLPSFIASSHTNFLAEPDMSPSAQ